MKLRKWDFYLVTGEFLGKLTFTREQIKEYFPSAKITRRTQVRLA